MKITGSLAALVLLLASTLELPLYSQALFWDPDGATPGTSISGNWNTTASNWTAVVDSGVSNAWTQGSEADFNIAANYTVTLTQPITVGNIVVSGAAGTLTISGTAANNLTLGGSSTLNTGGRNVTISAPINGAFDLTRAGAGTLTLSGAGAYSGGTTLNAGTLALGVSSAFSGGVVTSGALGTGAVLNNASTTIQASGGARTLDNPLTLNGNLTVAGSSALTFRNGDFKLTGGNRTLTVNNTADTTIQSALTDDGTARTLTKAGTGRLVLATGANTTTFLGGITATAGTLAAGSDTPFPTNNANSLTINGPGTILDLNGNNIRVSRLAGNATATVLLGNNTLTAGSSQSAEFSGVISGTGSYVKVGSVSQVLSGTNTFTGGITIMESALYLPTNAITGSPIALGAGGNTITITGTGRIGANRNSPSISIVTNNVVLATVGPTAGLDPANGGLFVLAGRVSGTGGILRYTQGSGTATLSGDNTFSGGTEIDARTLGIGHRHALGTGPLIVGNPTVPPGNAIALATFTDLKGANAITNVTTFNQSFAIFATNDFEPSGPITISNLSQTTITSLGDHTINFSGNIDGVGSLNKQGTNDLTLSGANTYAGDTTVSFGNLFVRNTTGSATGTNNVTVLASATLSGNGIVAGPVTVSGGGGIGAGTNADKLTLQNGLDMTGGGTNLWTLASEKDLASGTAGTDFSQVALTGGNLALGTSSLLALQFAPGTAPVFAHAFWSSNHTWRIIALSGGAANPGSSAFSAIAGTNGINAGTFSTSVDGSGNVLLSFTPLPAPPAPVVDSHLAGAGTGDVTISWSAVNGVTYQVQYKDDLTAANWTVLGTVTATGSTASFEDTTTPPPAHRFYRVIVP